MMCRGLILLAAACMTVSATAMDTRCPPEWSGLRPPDSDLTLCWSLSGDALHVEMSHPGRVWIALGFGNAMVGADVVVGRPETGEVLDMSIGGYEADDVSPDARQNIGTHAAVFDGERTTVRFSRALDTGDDADHVIVAGQPDSIIWAVGEAPGFSAHFIRGVANMDWGRSASFAWNAKIIGHSVLMVLAWLLLMPLGVIIARYYKVLDSQDYPKELDNQFWWYSHLVLQYAGMLFVVIGLWIIWNSQASINDIHAMSGIAAISLGGAQVLSGLLRGSKGGPVDDDGHPNPPEKIRGDHYDMTLHRRIFEVTHKSGGYLALAAGIITIILGLRQTGIHWIAYAALVAWICLIIAVFLHLQKNGRWIDTYHAIWGPDDCHPGNQDRARKRGTSFRTRNVDNMRNLLYNLPIEKIFYTRGGR